MSISAELNIIAPLLSNFFLMAYVLINFSVFHATITKSPGWRPAFKYYNAWVSLFGCVLCMAVMWVHKRLLGSLKDYWKYYNFHLMPFQRFLMSWITALITVACVIFLYLYVSYRKPEVNWGSSTQAQSYNKALKSIQDLNYVEEHVKNYRPQILVLSGMLGNLFAKFLSFRNWELNSIYASFRFSSSFDRLYIFVGQKSLSHDHWYEVDLLNLNPWLKIFNVIQMLNWTIIAGHVIKGHYSQKVKATLVNQAYRWLSRHKKKGFYTVVEDESFEHGARSIMQICGLGKLKPNMVMLGYKADWVKGNGQDLKEYVNVIQ